MEVKLGFFRTLFDFSFSEFVTTKIIKILYGLAILGAGVLALVMIVTSFRASVAGGFLMLILSPLVFLAIVIYARIILEVLIVMFRIAEHTGEIAKQVQKQP